jgi:hypothetical protein
MSIIKGKKGGWRPNSGRKKKYDEDTEMTCFRLPISHKKKIKKIVSDYLKTIQINENNR